jgi:hypothetical protein
MSGENAFSQVFAVIFIMSDRFSCESRNPLWRLGCTSNAAFNSDF